LAPKKKKWVKRERRKKKPAAAGNVKARRHPYREALPWDEEIMSS